MPRGRHQRSGLCEQSCHGARRPRSLVLLLATAALLHRHSRQIRSTNPLDRVNREIERRTDGVGVFPDPAVLLCLAGSVLIEQREELDAGGRRYFFAASQLDG